MTEFDGSHLPLVRSGNDALVVPSHSSSVKGPSVPTQPISPNGSFERPTDRATPAGIRVLTGTVDTIGIPKIISRNAELYGESEPADYVYKVVCGAVRAYKVLLDDRRHIDGFSLPGDIVGLGVEDVHAFSAEAITRSKVLVVERSALMALAERNSDVAHQLRLQAARETQRVQRRLLMLKLTAQERVVAFVLEMAERMSDRNSIELQMPRRDIADYLGLTIETVSRMLGHLQSTAAIEMQTSRRITLRSLPALSRQW